MHIHTRARSCSQVAPAFSLGGRVPSVAEHFGIRLGCGFFPSGRSGGPFGVYVSG